MPNGRCRPSAFGMYTLAKVVPDTLLATMQVSVEQTKPLLSPLRLLAT